MAEPRSGIALLLHGLQSPFNVGAVLRMAETFALPVDIWDTAGLFADAEKRAWIADFACGAFDRGAYRLLDRAPARGERPGREIATCLTADAIPLPAFRFRPGDRIAIGNEYEGLPTAFIAAADARLRIPMADVWTPKTASRHPIDPERAARRTGEGTPVLSAAMAAGIVGYTAFIQSGAIPAR